jgi:hypothetical protein
MSIHVNSVVTEVNTVVQESIQRLLAGMQEQRSSTGSATR